MSFIKTAVVSAAAFFATCAVAQAATLSGTFDVRVVNYSYSSNQNSSVAIANQSNFDTRWAAATDGVNRDTFTYTGDLNFFIDNLNPRDGDLESISDFFMMNGTTTPVGSISGLDATVGALQLSKPTFRITTLFEFTEVYLNSFATRVTHDDGFSIYDDGVQLISFANPTVIRTTPTTGMINFSGGEFKLVYAAANGNPSKLLVEGTGIPVDNNPTPVPLPASALLLIGGVGIMGAMRARKKRN